jgi:predicted Fe-Mo cluster-binding NifX family protein
MSLIAVSAQGDTPEASVDPRFGRAKGFGLYDPSAQYWSYLSNDAAQAQAQGAGLAAVELLARAKVTVVLSGSIGPKAAVALRAAGIASVEGADGQTVRQAVAAHLEMPQRGDAKS